MKTTVLFKKENLHDPFFKKGVRIQVQFMIRRRKNFISTNSNRQYKKLHEFVKKVGFSLEVSRHPNISNFMVRYLIKLMRMTSGHSPTCSRFVRKKKFSGIFQYCYPWKFTDPFPMNFVVSRGRRKGAWKGFLPWIRNNESSDSSLYLVSFKRLQHMNLAFLRQVGAATMRLRWVDVKHYMTQWPITT